MELSFDVEDLVLDELAVTAVGDAAFADGGAGAASCSCCSQPTQA
ncbi:hypothetical protein [Saccharothrix australiensis]|uniref:Thiazolylpeptide-type bacteriocin n=1 Tax=Saccharothrix australiensis TaxID=2072 RepID=A0A495W0V4_9PSEU|nr:hypothetical protein [Saccharothrix australiensis]RKT54740.1 hypothetical protein C8E97_3388 [Saccharothrix australiensis]